MHCLKRLDESVMARTFERQVVELHGIRPANPSTSNEELQAPGVHVVRADPILTTSANRTVTRG